MRTVLPRKTVHIDERSRLYRITGCNPCRVNALHHQSVDRLGSGLRVVARDEAGVVQAIEGGRAVPHRRAMAPRTAAVSAPQQRIFAALAAATRPALERAA